MHVISKASVGCTSYQKQVSDARHIKSKCRMHLISKEVSDASHIKSKCRMHLISKEVSDASHIKSKCQMHVISKPFSIGKFILHRCDPRECGKFYMQIRKGYGRVYPGKRVSEPWLMGTNWSTCFSLVLEYYLVDFYTITRVTRFGIVCVYILVS
jgi:hypothetical protein